MKTNTLQLRRGTILRGLRTATIAATAFCATSFAMAQSETVSYVQDAGAAQRINSAGKLRMLSQRVVAAACYVQEGVAIEATTAMMISAEDEFRQITAALEFGDPSLGINGAETDVKTLATIERLHVIWDPMAEIIDKLIEGTATREEVTEMELQSEPLLEMSQRLVAAVTAEYSLGAEMVMRDAMAIDIAGRQRMLAQRISKDVCLLATGVDTDHSMDDLAESASIFDTSLSALRNGMPAAGIQAPTDKHVIEDLEKAAADWAIAQTKVADVLAGEPVSIERLEVMFDLANMLTADMNKVVIDYTAAAN